MAPADYLIRELSQDERPRERLYRHGSASLSDAELIAILLRTGHQGVSALELARRVLDGVGGVAGLRGGRPEKLERPGLGKAKASSLLAAIELGRRIAKARLPERQPLSRPSQVMGYLDLRYGSLDQEILGALFLDSRNRLIRDLELFRGTLNRAAVEPRAILKNGLLLDASGVILFHNHPSGDPSPSAQDLEFTRRMVEAGELVGVHLVDHVILAGGAWVSLRQRQPW